MSLAPGGLSVVPARIALLLLLPLPALGEPGPPPHEHHTDRHGYPLPPGAVARLGVPPALDGFPWALGWTADGRRFVTVDSDGVTVFDAATGHRIETQTIGTAGRNRYTPLSRDGPLLFLLNGPTGLLYDTVTADARSFPLPAPFADPDRKVYSLDLSADCRFLAGVAGPPGGPAVAWRFDLARNRFTRLLADRANLHSVRLAPDGRRAYATGGTAEPELTARDLVTGKELWTVGLKGISLLRAVSADGRRLAVSDRDAVRVFDADSGTLVLTAPVDSSTPPGLWGIDLSPDGGRLAVAVDRTVMVWDTAAGKILHRLPHKARLVAFAPDGRSLLSLSTWAQRWDVATGRPAFPAPLLEKPAAPSLLRWSGDGKRLLTVWPGDRRGDEREWTPDVLVVWDVGRMAVAWRQTSPTAVTEAALDHTGTTVRAVTADDRFRAWSLGPTTTETVAELKAAPAAAPERVVEFLPDGRLIVQHHGTQVVAADVYDPAGRHLTRREVPSPWSNNWQRTRAAAQPNRAQPGVMLHPDGKRTDLMTGGPLPPLDTRDGQMVLKGPPLVGGSALIASRVQARAPSGEPAVEGIVWDARTGGQVVLVRERIPDWAAAALAPDGRWLAHATESAIELSDLARPHDGPPLHRPVADTKSLAFSPDGAALATAHVDGTVLVWDVPVRRSPWTAADADALWTALESSNAEEAWQALWHLLDYPGPATAILADRLKPVPGWTDTAEQIARLDHARYAVREAAYRELARRGEVVEGDLRAALTKNPPAEPRQRLESLLARLDPAAPPRGDTLRGLRATWLLERIGTAEAKRILERLAAGATGSPVTLEATAALRRLQPPVPPR